MRRSEGHRPRLLCLILLFAILSLAALTAPAAAQPRPAPGVETHAAPGNGAGSGEGAKAALEMAPDSPRASVKSYLDLCRAGEYAEAAEYLDLAEPQKAQGPVLARKLKAVLDRQIWVKIEDISPASLGRDNDNLPPGVEEIGFVPGRSGQEPVRLVRRRGPDGMRWLFSRSTVDRIPDWYSRLRDRWIQDYLPGSLLRPGPQELVWWQWIALPVLFIVALGFGKLLGYATRRLIARFTRRTEKQTEKQKDESVLLRLSGPLTFTWALVAINLIYPALGLYPPGEVFMETVIRAGFFLAFFWFVIRGIDVAGERVLEMPGAKGNPAALSLIPLSKKFLKIAVIAMAAIAVLSEFGYPVTSLVAGVGIGGVALALAAQKTVENLFGSISIGIDQPFRVGDFITVDTVIGTVESIGLRSTRIRTLDRTLVTIPNGKLADMRIESFAERDRIRFLCVLSLTRESRAAAVQEVLSSTRTWLLEHPKVWPDLSVSLLRITDASLDIEISAWFSTTDWSEFQRIRGEVLLHLLEIVERAGTELAYPTHKLHLTRSAEAGLPTSW
jgi:MscS family membrane protein